MRVRGGERIRSGRLIGAAETEESLFAHPACRIRRLLGTLQWQSALLVVGL